MSSDVNLIVRSIASQLSGWCSCQVRIENSLADMGIFSVMSDFITKLNEAFELKLTELDYKHWATIKDVIDYIESKVL